METERPTIDSIIDEMAFVHSYVRGHDFASQTPLRPNRVIAEALSRPLILRLRLP